MLLCSRICSSSPLKRWQTAERIDLELELINTEHKILLSQELQHKGEKRCRRRWSLRRLNCLRFCGDACLPSGPITVVAVGIAAMCSYIFGEVHVQLQHRPRTYTWRRFHSEVGLGVMAKRSYPDFFFMAGSLKKLDCWKIVKTVLQVSANAGPTVLLTNMW